MPDTLSAKLRDQATLYALDALTNSELHQFEQLLKANPALQKEVDEIVATLNLTKLASDVKLPEYVLEGQRNLLRGKIEQLENLKRQSGFKVSLSDLWYNLTKRIFIPRQPAWAVATYVMVAFLIGRLALPTLQTVSAPISTSPQPDVMQLLESGTLSSSDIDIFQNDAQSVNFNLQAKNDFSVQGGLNDETIRQILYYMLKNDSNPGKRLKAINLLSEAQPVEAGRIVLISSMLTDPNPGVRLRAAKSLNAYKSDKTLRNACVKVLFED
ncbi:MAG: HEAT repeat domain-containing protein, partial [Candidatus Marinimicrobia bacterium]|nr:HEAT repeat domain-containing protein [Candidatus Neomarinimicrobiota bacterium]